jgi:hypothetical protein
VRLDVLHGPIGETPATRSHCVHHQDVFHVSAPFILRQSRPFSQGSRSKRRILDIGDGSFFQKVTERWLAFPTEVQATAEKDGQPFCFLSRRLSHPPWFFEEGLNGNLDAASLNLVPPDAPHEAVDQQDWRDPPLRPVDASAQIAR